ncbi:hypothetical protein ACPCHQ_17040 [Ralstonia thomasii]|jgi:hypothetical protein|uniref:Uncharacterized protein n=2 Tax=Ralstonia TaxID=48736 RepID=A0ABN9JC32_9RALS|nr:MULTISPECIES: hypothetical protein [Ralstonia]MBT2181018.1 hypothetical protein [Ralstonia pickettii]CAJ0710698.1 hypothetical protein LMG7143_01692 [Ralstonia sp. LMG 18095]CAJ0806273.1 hypothetical protein LMG18095_04413 [Ralstonia sp. LMG 18095]
MHKNNLLEDEYVSAYVPAFQPHEFHEFPKWKHHAGGSSQIVNSAEEEADLGPDWYDTKQPVVEAEEKEEKAIESELDALIVRAGELGITIDKRWGIKRLREEIEKVSA